MLWEHLNYIWVLCQNFWNWLWSNFCLCFGINCPQIYNLFFFLECSCNPEGSKSLYCDEQSGQCDCKQGFQGKSCDFNQGKRSCSSKILHGISTREHIYCKCSQELGIQIICPVLNILPNFSRVCQFYFFLLCYNW